MTHTQLREPDRVKDTYKAFFKNRSTGVVISIFLTQVIYNLGYVESGGFVRKNGLLPIGTWIQLPYMWGAIVTFDTISGELDPGDIWMDLDGSGMIHDPTGNLFEAKQNDLVREGNGRISLREESALITLNNGRFSLKARNRGKS